MAVRIRLKRTGKKHQASYRIVVADKKVKRDGKVIEVLGFYNPTTKPLTLKLDRVRFDHWLSVGAQPSDTVRRLILGQRRRRMKNRKKPTTTETQKKRETEKGEKTTAELQNLKTQNSKRKTTT